MTTRRTVTGAAFYIKDNTVSELETRLAKLEQREDENRRKMDKIFIALDELKAIQQNQKGFIGGVVFTVGAVFTMITWFFHDKISGI